MFDRQVVNMALLMWGCLFCLFAGVCMMVSHNFEAQKRIRMMWMQFTCALLLGSDVAAWAFRGAPGQMAYLAVRTSNGMVFFLSDALLLFFHSYVCCCLFERPADENVKITQSSRPKRLIRAGYILCVIGMLLVLVSQFTNLYYYIDESNLYHRSRGYVLSFLIPLAGMMIDTWLLLAYRKNIERGMLASMLSYIVLPLAATIIQLFYYGISLINLMLAVSMLLMFFAAIQDQNKALRRKEKEAADLRITLMLSQIAPHFIYNTLTSIKTLCVKNPAAAQKLVDDFAIYLRGNLESLTHEEKIPFTQEIEHVRHYLAIEQVRFGERIHVEWDLQEEDFLLPALTVQILVENAVKHGICRKEEGGTVHIAACRMADGIEISVADDGVGFDTEILQQEPYLHVGLQNAKNRIQNLCNGTLTIRSQIGQGTLAVVHLPQKEMEK